LTNEMRIIPHEIRDIGKVPILLYPAF